MPLMMVWPVSESRVDPEGGILLGQLAQAGAQLVLVGLGPRLDRHGDHRFRKVHRLQDDGVIGIADRVAGSHALEADHRRDVARVHLVALLALVRVHLQQAPPPAPCATGWR